MLGVFYGAEINYISIGKKFIYVVMASNQLHYFQFPASYLFRVVK